MRIDRIGDTTWDWAYWADARFVRENGAVVFMRDVIHHHTVDLHDAALNSHHHRWEMLDKDTPPRYCGEVALILDENGELDVSLEERRGFTAPVLRVKCLYDDRPNDLYLTPIGCLFKRSLKVEDRNFMMWLEARRPR